MRVSHGAESVEIEHFPGQTAAMLRERTRRLTALTADLAKRPLFVTVEREFVKGRFVEVREAERYNLYNVPMDEVWLRGMVELVRGGVGLGGCRP